MCEKGVYSVSYVAKTVEEQHACSHNYERLFNAKLSATTQGDCRDAYVRRLCNDCTVNTDMSYPAPFPLAKACTHHTLEAWTPL